MLLRVSVGDRCARVAPGLVLMLLLGADQSAHASSVVYVVVQPAILDGDVELNCEDLERAWDELALSDGGASSLPALLEPAARLHCCELVPRIAALVSWESAGWLDEAACTSLIEIGCPVGNEYLAGMFREALACEDVPLGEDWLAAALGGIADVPERALLRDEWLRERPSTCDGQALLDTNVLALALTLAGDDIALPTLISAFDGDMFYDDFATSRGVARALCQLPATTRRRDVPRLVSRMTDDDQRDALILASVDLGCWDADDLSEPALARRALREERVRQMEEDAAAAAREAETDIADFETVE